MSISKFGKNYYRIDISGKAKVFYCNLLKKYVKRQVRGERLEVVSAGACRIVEGDTQEIGELDIEMPPVGV